MSKTTQEWMTFENLCSDTEGREAVAEVVRLREELEALRRACIESAEEAERNAEVAYIPDPYVAVEEAERDTADIITRILDGSES